MTSYERVIARIKGEKVDRIPNLCILMNFAAKEIGVSYGNYISDYKLLVEGNLVCHEKYGIDLLCAISDPMRECEGFGAKVIIEQDGSPHLAEPFITNIEDISHVKVVKPENARRMNDRLQGVRLLKECSCDDLPVCGWVEGAFAECCDLRGINEFMMDILTEPERSKELIEICTKQAIAFATAQIDAGADIIGIGDAAASLLGPDYYKEFAFQYEKEVIAAIHEKGAFAKLHICGNINSIINDISETKADLIDCDWMVDFCDANKNFGNNHSLVGNFDPVAILLQGSVSDVNEAVEKCVSFATNKTMIAAGCEVPRDTPKENLLAVHETLLKLSGQ